MKRIKKFITTIMLLGALTLSVFAFTGCKTSEEETSNNDNIDVGIAVLTSYASTTEDGQKCLAQEVVATVSGISSITQPIDLQWTLYIPPLISPGVENPIWGDRVSDYIILEVSSYNEVSQTSTCVLKLIKAIPDGGIIRLKVNCNNNNISKSIIVKYNPIPYTVGLYSDTPCESYYDDTVDAYIKDLVIGKTYSWKITGFDFFGNPFFRNPEEGFGFLAAEEAIGSFKMGNPNDIENAKSYHLDDFINVRNSNYTEYFSYDYDLSTGTLTIIPKTTLEDLKIYDSSNETGDTYVEYLGYEYNEPFFLFVITDGPNSTDSLGYDLGIRVVSAE